ncbi:myb-like protein X [Chelonus insularis]|uniref:myb-like protein X n=1 Tax=Chelonus insularis TaxID=460826 RepID=UPI00158A342B|nr:myb-like protein X [Chelonus insularis]
MEPWTTTSRRSKTKEKTKDGQEEMKNQLKEAGLYEEGMSTNDMENFLKIVDDSKQLARKNDHTSQPDLYEVPSSPLSSYGHNDNHLSSTSNQGTNINDLVTSESSTAFHSNKLINKNSTNNDKSSTSQEKLDDSSYSHYTISPSSDRKLELNSMHRTPTNQESRSYSSVLFNQLEQWRINPLDCKKMENDVPLSRKKRSSVQRPKFQMVNGIPVIPDEIRNKQRTILDDTAELYYRYMQKPNNDEVQWGTPIKVGTANGSLDKYLISPSEEHENSISELYNTSIEGGKFSLRPRNATKKVTYIMSDDEEDEEIFQSKRKKVAGFTHKSSATKNGLIKNRNNNVESNQQKRDYQSNISKYDESDNLNIISDGGTSRKKRAATPEYPEISPSKQIPSSNKSNSYDVVVEIHNEEKRQNTNFSRKNNSIDCEPIRPIKKRNEKLNDEEIEAQLITDDEDEEEKVIPPSPESRFSKRLRLGHSLLQNKRQKEEDKRKKIEEEERLAAEKETRDKEEKIKQRMENNIAKAKQHEMIVKKQKEKEERYRNNVARHQKCPSRTELESDELPKNEIIWDTKHESSETTYTETEANKKIVKQIKNRVEEVQCPICGKNFPIDQVETHAGSCEAYVDEDEQTNNHSKESQQFQCMQCDFFSTNDQEAYEHHVSSECLEISHNQHKKGENSLKTTYTKTSNTSIKTPTRKRKR